MEGSYDSSDSGAAGTGLPEFVDVIYPDLSGVIRGKRYPGNCVADLLEKGISIPGSVFLLDVTGENHDPAGHGFSDGDPDCLAWPIEGSFAPVPWLPHNVGQVMVTFAEFDGRPYRFEPRNVLRGVVEKLAESKLFPVVAFELEFFLISRTRGDNGGPVAVIPNAGYNTSSNQLMGLDDVENAGDFLRDLHEACEAQGLPVTAMSSEYAPGQFEVNLHHVADPLLAADHSALLRRAVRGVARRHDLDASFMSKPFLDQPGSGMHVHVSLKDADGKPMFDGSEGPSPMLEHAVRGLLDALPQSMALFAPNRNSYRRFLPNLFVPITRSWGYDNRSVAVRIPRTPAGGWRFEHRVAGADANPYLVLAAILAGVAEGLRGAESAVSPSEGNAGSDFDRDLPFDLTRALELLVEPGPLGEYIPDEYRYIYKECKAAEWRKLDRPIPPLEYAFYL